VCFFVTSIDGRRGFNMKINFLCFLEEGRISRRGGRFNWREKKVNGFSRSAFFNRCQAECQESDIHRPHVPK